MPVPGEGSYRHKHGCPFSILPERLKRLLFKWFPPKEIA